MTLNHPRPVSVFLCGDVMTGRGVDQVLTCPSSSILYEPEIHDACEYVRLAESVNGPIPRPVDPAYIWGDAIADLERAQTDVLSDGQRERTDEQRHEPNTHQVGVLADARSQTGTLTRGKLSATSSAWSSARPAAGRVWPGRR